MGHIQYPGLENLPPLTHDATTMLLLRESQHVTIVFQRSNGDRVGVFTLHRIDANKLAERLKELANAEDGETTVVEGAYIGGPPAPDQLLRPEV